LQGAHIVRLTASERATTNTTLSAAQPLQAAPDAGGAGGGGACDPAVPWLFHTADAGLASGMGAGAISVRAAFLEIR